MPVLSTLGGASKRGFARYRTPTTITYATWNPADKGGGVVLSNGNLSVTLSTTPTDGGSVRSTIGKSSGKWYWEITVNGGSAFSLPGVANASASVASSNYYASGVNGFGYYSSNGNKYNNGPAGAYGATCAPGDVIGVALDMTGGTLIFYKNGVSQGTAFTGLTGTYYAAEGNYTLNQAISTANFGATAFAFSVPSGYNAGLYT